MKRLSKFSPWIKYLLFLWLALFPCGDLYVASFNLYINKYVFLILYFAVCLAFSYGMRQNDQWEQHPGAKVCCDLLLPELFCFALFAQYYPIVAILLTLLATAAGLWLYIRIELRGKSDKRRTLHNRARALLGSACCVLLLIPSALGVYREYTFLSMREEDWKTYTAAFETHYTEDSGEALFETYDDTLSGLVHWDTLGAEERIALLYGVVRVEQDYLGIESVELLVAADKIGENTHGYYSHEDKKLRLNIAYVADGNLEENLSTVCHEVFHAFQHDIVDALDFDSDLVKHNYYFKKAQSWKNNSDYYVSGLIDYEAYQSQPLEADARAYAEERLKAYRDYLAGKTTG